MLPAPMQTAHARRLPCFALLGETLANGSRDAKRKGGRADHSRAGVATKRPLHTHTHGEGRPLSRGQGAVRSGTAPSAGDLATSREGTHGTARDATGKDREGQKGRKTRSGGVSLWSGFGEGPHRRQTQGGHDRRASGGSTSPGNRRKGNEEGGNEGSGSRVEGIRIKDCDFLLTTRTFSRVWLDSVSGSAPPAPCLM